MGERADPGREQEHRTKPNTLQFWGEGASEREHGAVRRTHQCGHAFFSFYGWDKMSESRPSIPTARGKEGKYLGGGLSDTVLGGLKFLCKCYLGYKLGSHNPNETASPGFPPPGAAQ